MKPIEHLGKIVREQSFCHAPDSGVFVDVHFFRVGFTEAAADSEAFLQARDAALTAEHGYFQSISHTRMKQGPSYIEIGAWIGDQTLALQFMGLSEHHGVGKVITPKLLGLTGDKATVAAGGGYVLLAPVSTEVPA